MNTLGLGGQQSTGNQSAHDIEAQKAQSTGE
jgi:hypothetical protein